MVEYAKKKNDELITLLKERNLPHSGKKADLVKRLEEDDAKKTAAAAPATTTANEDEIDWDDDAPATEVAKTATTEPAANAIAAGGQGGVKNPQAVPNQEAAIDPSKTNDLSVAAAPKEAPVPDATATTAAGVGADAELEKKEKTEAKDSKYAAGLAERTLDEEIEKRKARAKRFGLPEDSEEIKALERAKRFGVSELTGLVELNKALPETKKDWHGKKDRKRGREGGENDGGPRKSSRGPPAQGKMEGGDRSKGAPSWMSEADRAAAERRKARFAAA